MLFLLSSIVNLGQFVIWSRFITKLYHGNQPYSFALYIITSKITLQTYVYEINDEQNLQSNVFISIILLSIHDYMRLMIIQCLYAWFRNVGDLTIEYRTLWNPSVMIWFGNHWKESYRGTIEFPPTACK